MTRRELRTRIVMGLAMALLAAGVLLADGRLALWLNRPFYPCLFVGVFLLTILGTLEMRALLKPIDGPPLWILLLGALTVFLANWPGHLGLDWLAGDPFRHVAYAFTAWVLLAFLFEMAVYRPGGNAVVRGALFVWAIAYLGVLPTFFVQLRFGAEERGVAALGVLIATTKGGDIGAYFTGRFLGRHPMTPLLSPKKTWEGFAGGLATSVGAAVAIHFLRAGLFATIVESALFGGAVGVMGVLGDLAESMVKRDCGAKDASNVVPGFGGILDVVDSIIFAAPLAYWWLTRGGS